MIRKFRILPPSRHLIIIILATMWLNIQTTDSRDTYKRFKRWSTTLLANKPAEQHECQDDADCRNLPFTSCAQDIKDKNKKKCLCPDYTQPSSSGDCKRLPKALRTPCQADVECLQGAECISLDDSKSGKACYCREDYQEVNNTCTNGCSFTVAGPVAVALSATLTFWTYN